MKILFQLKKFLNYNSWISKCNILKEIFKDSISIADYLQNHENNNVTTEKHSIPKLTILTKNLIGDTISTQFPAILTDMYYHRQHSGKTSLHRLCYHNTVAVHQVVFQRYTCGGPILVTSSFRLLSSLFKEFIWYIHLHGKNEHLQIIRCCNVLIHRRRVIGSSVKICALYLTNVSLSQVSQEQRQQIKRN